MAKNENHEENAVVITKTYHQSAKETCIRYLRNAYEKAVNQHEEEEFYKTWDLFEADLAKVKQHCFSQFE